MIVAHAVNYSVWSATECGISSAADSASHLLASFKAAVKAVTGTEPISPDFVNRGTQTSSLYSSFGTSPPIERRMEARYCSVMRVADGLVVEVVIATIRPVSPDSSVWRTDRARTLPDCSNE